MVRVLALARPGGLPAVNLAGALAAGVLVGIAPRPDVLILVGGGLLGDPGTVASRLAWPLVLGLVAAALGRAVGGLL